MTLKEFYAKLVEQTKKHRTKWVIKDGNIRTQKDECPLSYLSNRLCGTNFKKLVLTPAENLNLDFDAACAVANAADDVKKFWYMRSTLLSKLNLVGENNGVV